MLLPSFTGKKEIVHLQPGTVNCKMEEQIFSPSAFIVQRTGDQNWTCTKPVITRCKVLYPGLLSSGKDKKRKVIWKPKMLTERTFDNWPFFARPGFQTATSCMLWRHNSIFHLALFPPHWYRPAHLGSAGWSRIDGRVPYPLCNGSIL